MGDTPDLKIKKRLRDRNSPDLKARHNFLFPHAQRQNEARRYLGCRNGLTRPEPFAIAVLTRRCGPEARPLPLAMTDSRSHAALATSQLAATFTRLLDPHVSAPVPSGNPPCRDLQFVAV
jgi:hypothetical protein